MNETPDLVLLMGCHGAGKTEWLGWRRDAWRRAHSLRYFLDPLRLARGLGRRAARELAAELIGECFAEGQPFGVVGTFACRRFGPALMARAIDEGYRVDGYYIGTESCEVNRRRLAGRSLQRGPRIDPETLPGCRRRSLANLREHLGAFDSLEVADNSHDTRSGGVDCVVQFEAEHGRITPREGPIEPWADELMRGAAHAMNGGGPTDDRPARA